MDDRISHILDLVGPALLLPWPRKSKGTKRRWKHLELTAMDDEGHLAKLRDAGNIGVALGRVSEGLVSIDLDQSSYVDAFLEANPLLRNTLRTKARRGCNIWVRCAAEYPPAQRLKNSSGEEIGEWRGDGNQTIIAGTHPEGMRYQFVVKSLAVTMNYDAIIWPESILPPHTTESKRVRGVREYKVVDLSVVYGKSGSIEAFCSDNPISKIAPTGPHQNNASLFKLARLVRDYESVIGRLATEEELEFFFEQWTPLARPFWRAGLTRDDYWAEFLEADGYARVGLNEDPIDLALSRAKAKPLPEVPGFKEEPIRLLVAICRELQQITGSNPFYMPTRKVAKHLGVHYTEVARRLRILEKRLKIIHLAPGEVRRRGGTRCPRYCLVYPSPSVRWSVPSKAMANDTPNVINIRGASQVFNKPTIATAAAVSV